jgi:CRP-like cAMP-binding protein
MEVAICSEGSSFGELALLKNKPRTATIRCKTDTHCAVIDKESYQKIIKQIQEKQLNEKIEFLKTLP